LTDGSFGKRTVVEVGCSNSKGLRFKMSLFHTLMQGLPWYLPQICIS
jgi:hypothetical protein